MNIIFNIQKSFCLIFFAFLLSSISACSDSDSGSATVNETATAGDTATDEPDNNEEEGDETSDQIDPLEGENPPTGFDELWGVDSEGSGDQAVVFWPRPVRAHPGIPFEYGMVAYDKENDTLSYALSNAPEGMTIDALGIIRWQPNVESGNIEFDVLVDDGRDIPIVVSVSISIRSEDFFFVSTEGRSGANGSIDDPFDSVSEAMRALRDKGYGTLLIRGGTYITSLDSATDPWQSVIASPSEPLEVMAYPGEHVIIDYNYASGGFAFYNSRFIYIRNLEFAKASLAESGGLVVISDHIVMTRVTIRDNDWNATNNVSGFYMAGHDVVAHRCRGLNNYDRNVSHPHNSVNYNFYADKTTPLGDHRVYVLHSYSENSQQGYRIKHAGAGRIHLHGSIDIGSDNGWGGYDNGSTLTFNIFKNNDIPMRLFTDPEPTYAQDDMQVSNNTAINFNLSAVELPYTFGTDGNNRFHHNIFVTDNTLGSLGISTRMMDLWRYIQDPNSVGINHVSSDYNCFFAPNDNEGFHMATVNHSWDSWRTLGLDTNSVWADPELDNENYRLSETSNCHIPGQRMGARN